MRLCSAPRMAGRIGRNFPDCAKRKGIFGNPEQAGCACIRSFLTRVMLSESLSPSQPQARSALVMEVRHGSQLTKDLILHMKFLMRAPRLGIVFIILRCIRRDRM